jgi:TolA-binding protein
MKRNSLFSLFLSPLMCMAALGQSGPASGSPSNAASGGASAQGAEPVSYASVTQLNGILAQLETTSKSTQADLGKLRIERWKTDGATKKQSLANVDSIQRNLQEALPAIIAELRAAPEDLPATFKL